MLLGHDTASFFDASGRQQLLFERAIGLEWRPGTRDAAERACRGILGKVD